MTALSELGRAAVEYANMGFAVFPCMDNGKEPATKHGFKDATSDPDVIRRVWADYPECNIGIATGAPSGGVFVVDVDNHNGVDGSQFIVDWQREHGTFPETACATTGSGGEHLFFCAPAGVSVRSAAHVIDGVDVRGDGGYVVAPPSRHPNGSLYEWDLHPDDYPIAEANQSVLDLVRNNGAQDRKPFELPERIKTSKRNDTLFKYAASLQAKGMDDKDIFTSVGDANRARCDSPLDDKELRTLVNSALGYDKGKSKNEVEHVIGDSGIRLMVSSNGTVKQTIENALRILKGDAKLSGRFWWSETGFCRMADLPLPWDGGDGPRPVIDEDYAALTAYCERFYGVHTKEGVIDAVAIESKSNSRNPVRDWLESLEWDGTERIGGLLGMLGCKCDEYEQAVMRLWLTGAVARALEPGIKFDYMPVLVGEQGIGKSKFASLFCPNREWYDDNFKTIEGDAAIEKLRGLWIAEFAELLATKRAKDVEGIKAFITSTGDSIRPKYGRETVFRPRCCVFIGTTNDEQFLTDATGNRRFLPIQCHNQRNQCDPFLYTEGAHVWFAQAVAEAVRIWKDERPSLTLPKEMLARAESMQERYTEDDPLPGLVAEYMAERYYSAKYANPGEIGERVCSREIYENLPEDYRRGNSMYVINDINRAMGSIEGWARLPKKAKTANYGVQRCWVPTR